MINLTILSGICKSLYVLSSNPKSASLVSYHSFSKLLFYIIFISYVLMNGSTDDIGFPISFAIDSNKFWTNDI